MIELNLKLRVHFTCSPVFLCYLSCMISVFPMSLLRFCFNPPVKTDFLGRGGGGGGTPIWVTLGTCGQKGWVFEAENLQMGVNLHTHKPADGS